MDLRPFKLFLRRYGGSGALCNDFLKMLLCGGDLRRFTPKKDRLAAMSECISTDTFSARFVEPEDLPGLYRQAASRKRPSSC